MSRLPLLPFVFIVIVYVLFRVKYFFQASEKTVVIFASRLGTLEKLKSQKGRVSDSVWKSVLFGNLIWQPLSG